LDINSEFKARDYQADAINKSCEQQRGLVKCATGGGKTFIASGIIAELGVFPFVFYVTSCDLLKQAKDEIEKFVQLSGSPVSVGMIGGGKCEIKDINVMTVQTAVRALGGKYKAFDDEDKSKDNTDIEDKRAVLRELIMSARGMICDEVQHWASETCQMISEASVNAHYRYGLSATPHRDLGDDILIDACFEIMVILLNLRLCF
jgi:superfamily II DNA or RNA helicase